VAFGKRRMLGEYDVHCPKEPAMKIETVTATWLHADIPPEKQHTTDFGRVHAFGTVLVEVRTGGLTGYGEAKAASAAWRTAGRPAS
jgi:L-alanine-DL-glutamate epimerase-like enolase superfamily enzyme